MKVFLEKLVKEWGYTDIEDFAFQKAIEVLTHKFEQYTKEIQFYESKYGMSFDEFEKNVAYIKDKGIIEKEDDWMDWGGILHSFHSVKNKINKLKDENIIKNHSTIVEVNFVK
jgi:hypothetical protein